MTPKQLDQLIHKYLQGKCTEKEERLIDTYYRTLGSSSDPLEAHQIAFLQNKVKSGLLKKIRANNKFAYSFHYKMLTGVAASLLVAVGLFYILMQPKLETIETIKSAGIKTFFYENRTSIIKRIFLPDGSEAELSPNATIEYSEQKLSTKSRDVVLHGEAFFNVVHDKKSPFYVYANKVVTKVLGTSFRIKSSDKNADVIVSVRTGKVSVYKKDSILNNQMNNKIVLKPNQQAVYNPTTDQIKKNWINPQLTAATDPNLVMIFEETPINYVFKDMQSAYNIKIQFNLEMLSKCVLTSTFVDESLLERLEIICAAIGATYKISGSDIIIESKGC